MERWTFIKQQTRETRQVATLNPITMLTTSESQGPAMTENNTTELLPFDTQDLYNLCDQFKGTQFYFQMMRDSFISKYSEPQIEPAAGQGQSFPDQERTEQWDIRSLLLSQPKNVEAELKFHKELFSKLKFNYIQQDSQEKFLKRVLEIPGLFVQPEDVKRLEAQVESHKKELDERKTILEDKKNELESLIDAVSESCVNSTEKQKVCESLAVDIQTLETELKGLGSILPGPGSAGSILPGNNSPQPSSNVETLKQQMEDRQSAMNDLELEMAKWTDILQNKRASNAQLEGRVGALKPQKVRMESQAAESLRASKNKDPQFEELCKWYTEVNSLLYKFNGIAKIRNLSTTEFEIDYEEYDTKRVVATLLLKINPEAESQFKRMVNTKVKGIHCPIQDLVIHANLTATKLDEVISAIVTGTRSRIFEVVALQKEIEELSSKYEGLVFDPETRELLIHAEASGRAFVIRVKHGYPTSGWQGLEVVGIEPALQGSSELELWQDKLVQSQVPSLSALIPMLD